MFPIIHLRSQLQAVNKYIVRFQLSQDAIYLWLSCYGDLVKPDEESSLRFRERAEFYLQQYRKGYFEKDKKYRKIWWNYERSAYQRHSYRTSVGFLNAFHFVEFNQLEIQGLGRI